MARRVNIGIIGLGNIGSALVDVLRQNHAVILGNSGVDIRIKKVCDIRKVKTSYPLTHDPMALINDPAIDVVVEAIGGVQPALKFILAALNNKKHVVTPNKEVIAKHMTEILAAARKNNVQVLFEASVGGGIPIIQPLRECLTGNKLAVVYGIVNGTTNYILSKMSNEGLGFAQALKQAQDKGYAEPDPTSDVAGFDAAYKAAILASEAFGAQVDIKQVYREGITRISQEDIQYAKQIGYVIKLLAIAKLVDGKLDVRVHPALVSQSHPLATVSENFNAIYVQGYPLGELMFYGPGAGGGPTASALISDIITIAKSKNLNTKSRLAGSRKTLLSNNKEAGQIQNSKFKIQNIAEIHSRYYVRLQVPDKFGVLAVISRAFAKKKVSIAAVVQKETVGKVATLVILVHEVVEKNLTAALKEISRLSVVKKVGNVIRII